MVGIVVGALAPVESAPILEFVAIPEGTKELTEPVSAGVEPVSAGAEPVSAGAEPVSAGAEPVSTGAEVSTVAELAPAAC
jgi:hypothetical protein